MLRPVGRVRPTRPRGAGGPDALYDLPRAVKSLRAGVADVVERSHGRGLVQLDLTVGLECTDDQDRDLSVVLPVEAARALGIALLDLADEAEGLQ